MKARVKVKNPNTNSRNSHININSTNKDTKELKNGKKPQPIKGPNNELNNFESPKKFNKKGSLEQEEVISKNEKIIQKILFKKTKTDLPVKVGNNIVHEKKNSNSIVSNFSKDLVKSPDNNKNYEKEKKKEIISLAALGVLEMEDKQNIAVILPQKEESFWDKVFGFLNPFKCGAN